MNNKKQQNIQSEKTLTEIFKYNAGGEASEYHIIIHSTKPEDTYEEQLNAVIKHLRLFTYPRTERSSRHPQTLFLK